MRLKSHNIEVNISINNAGVASFGSIRDSDPETWWSAHESMLKGRYLVSRAYLRQRSLATITTGAILMTSSIGSFRPGLAMSSHRIPKTALNRPTDYIAAECAADNNGVQCIAFHPGGVADTGLTAGALDWLTERLTETAELAAVAALWLSIPRVVWLNGRYVDVVGSHGVEKVEGEGGRDGWVEDCPERDGGVCWSVSSENRACIDR